MSRFLTAQQHNLGHLVPLKVKSEKRESSHRTIKNNTPTSKIESVRYNEDWKHITDVDVLM